MNDRLKNFARSEILKDLQECNDAQMKIFRAMYAPHLSQLSIEEVVRLIPAEKLDWAMMQTRNTVLKNQGAR